MPIIAVMSIVDVESVLAQVDELLAKAGDLPEEAALAVEKLLNVVEALCSDRKKFVEEVQRLREQLDQKKKGKNSQNNRDDDAPPQDSSDHSSEKRRRQRNKKRRALRDRRSSKELTIHEEIQCPIDPDTLPPDAVRLDDEHVIVQDIEIKPRNIRFTRHVFYSAILKQRFRGPLPSSHDDGDFGADLRALIVSLKYCGNMSEPKIREFLENFDVQVSSGSVSNILTKTADSFADEFDEIVAAGLASTPYQQTDDTSARVDGEFWHTHVLCNPYYAAYFTRPRKDRLTMLEVLQNTSDLRFLFGKETRNLLSEEFAVPAKWESVIMAVGEQEFDRPSLNAMLDEWFGEKNVQLRTAIEQASAIAYYHHQTSQPVVGTIVCDDAGQFKLLTTRLSLCWIHAGRHYEKLSPVVARHAKSLDAFLERYWDYYQSLQDYRAGPCKLLAAKLRSEFDELFSTRTGYTALDDRISKTAAKRSELLTVLDEPWLPLHNNASELQARVSARRRDVSLHSRSERGARAMDIFTTIVQTSKLLGISSYVYLRDRVSKTLALPSLALSIQAAAKQN
jgi:hypothetical protein